MNDNLQQNHMNSKHLLIVLCLLVNCLSLVFLRNKAIDKDYSIGKIWDLHFMNDDRLLFRSQDDVFGFISGKTGELISVFELDPKESIVEFQSKYEVIISKQKQIHVFLPRGEHYFIMHESNYLATLNYTKVIGFKRFMQNTKILTDRQLVQLPNYINPSNFSLSQMKIIFELSDQNETLIGLIQGHKTNISLFPIITSKVESDTNTQFCMRSLQSSEISKKCFVIPKGKQIKKVLRSGNIIYVEFQDSAWYFDQNLNKMGQIDELPQQYHNGLVTIGEDHNHLNPYEKTVFAYRIIAEDQTVTKNKLTLKVMNTSMLVQNNFKDIVNILKTEEDNPRKVWAQWNISDANNHKLYIEFDDGRLICYKIQEIKKIYQIVWEIKTQKFDLQKEGEDIQASDEEVKGPVINNKQAQKQTQSTIQSKKEPIEIKRVNTDSQNIQTKSQIKQKSEPVQQSDIQIEKKPQP